MTRKPKPYQVCDGRLALTLEEAEEGGFIVTSPQDPCLVTQAETLREAFQNARDALKALNRSRKAFRNRPAGSARHDRSFNA